MATGSSAGGRSRSRARASWSPGSFSAGTRGCGLLLQRGWACWSGGVVAEAVVEQGEGALVERADVGGEPGGRLVGQDPSAGVVEQRALDADEGVRRDLGSGVVGRGVGLGGEQGGEGVGGAGERLLLAGQQGRTGGDDAVDRVQPFQRLGVTGFHLGEQLAGLLLLAFAQSHLHSRGKIARIPVLPYL